MLVLNIVYNVFNLVILLVETCCYKLVVCSNSLFHSHKLVNFASENHFSLPRFGHLFCSKALLRLKNLKIVFAAVLLESYVEQQPRRDMVNFYGPHFPFQLQIRMASYRNLNVQQPISLYSFSSSFSDSSCY